MKRLSLAEMRALQNDQLGFALTVAQEMGGVVHLKLAWFDMFLVTEPAVIRELLIHHGSRMQRDRFTTQVFKRFMGNGVFVAEGKKGQRQRKLVQSWLQIEAQLRQQTGIVGIVRRWCFINLHP